MNGFLRILSIGIGLSLLTAWILSNSAETQVPQRPKIAFTTLRHGNGEVYVTDENGLNPINLTNHWAHDGKAKWSPDGTKIAFSSNRDGGNDIFVMKADGTIPRNLTREIGTVETGASWSPDGKQIAFASYDNSPRGHVFVMTSDGRNVRDLGEGESPSWSPDGQRIAFTYWSGGNSDIYLMNGDGKQRRRLTDHLLSDWAPTWSSDGRRIAFASNRIADSFEIFTMDPNGRNLRRVTSDDWESIGCSWSADGNHLMFGQVKIRIPEQIWEIHVIRANGLNPRKLIGEMSTGPSWWNPTGYAVRASENLWTIWGRFKRMQE